MSYFDIVNLKKKSDKIVIHNRTKDPPHTKPRNIHRRATPGRAT